MRIVSLFSGAGGLDLGLIKAGHEILWANDIDEDAVRTYRENIGGLIIQDDISNINPTSIPDCDVVIGGFPCQGFSLANMQRSVSDERNLLYKFFHNVIQIKQPKYFIAENVKGILSLGKGIVVEHIVDDFEKSGYSVSVNLVNMADYGIPQTRQRVFIIGTRNDVSIEFPFIFPQKTHSKDKWVSIKDAIDSFPEPSESNAEYPNHIGSNYKLAYRNFTGHRVTNPEKPSPTILARGNGKGGVCAIPHYNGKRRLTIRESACIQTFPNDFIFFGSMGSCYRQIGNAVPVKFSEILGEELKRLEQAGAK